MPSKYFDQLIRRRKPETKEFVRQYLDILEHIHQIITTQGKDAVEARQLFNKFIQVLQSHERNGRRDEQIKD